MNSSRLESKLHKILFNRKKNKAIRYCLYIVICFLVLASVQTTIIIDTDWEKIGTLGTVGKALARFFPPDFSLFPQLVKPALETFMIACLGTFLALILAIPVSWFAAHNITPFKPITYPIGRAIGNHFHVNHHCDTGTVVHTYACGQSYWQVRRFGSHSHQGYFYAFVHTHIYIDAHANADAIGDTNSGQINGISRDRPHPPTRRDCRF